MEDKWKDFFKFSGLEEETISPDQEFNRLFRRSIEAEVQFAKMTSSNTVEYITGIENLRAIKADLHNCLERLQHGYVQELLSS